MPSESDDIEQVAAAIARISGYGDIHIDAISRELGWNVARNRARLDLLVQRMITLGYVATRGEDLARGATPPRLGLTAAGRAWLRAKGRR